MIAAVSATSPAPATSAGAATPPTLATGTVAGGWHVGVVIPAQNEAASIGRCLRSILAACRNCTLSASTWIVVVADGCSDDTAACARAVLGSRGEVLETNSKSPGAARRLGAASVLTRFEGAPLERIWLANTDADGYVPGDWLTLHLEHADEEASAVAGIVELEVVAGLRADVHRTHLAHYALPSEGPHSHVHGANIGVRGDAYVDVGGWSDLRVAEDHCLWGRLKTRGWRVCSPVRSIVVTSARLQGRAVGGFADTLRQRLACALA